MKTTFEYMDANKAINKIEEMKKKNKKVKFVICTIDFDNDTETRKIAFPSEGCVLIKKSKTIIFNDDNFFPHMELYSKIQDINSIHARGIMHDIFLFSSNFEHMFENSLDTNVSS